ncbi:hypothetical protein C2G38_2140317 [Gigaspora rosea]|uniref:Uncharacterized protein n=1 Tax=Gigaspora rosea TaxID=44941 RepID=A0A397VMD9_9GLOM|nr:hypothetical protein C2G38_2140317 [Gigaspora rosea]
MVKLTIILHAIIVILTLLPSLSTQLKKFTYEDPQAGLDLLGEDKSNDGTIIYVSEIPTVKLHDALPEDGGIAASAFYVLERGFALAYGGDDSPTNHNNSTVDISIVEHQNNSIWSVTYDDSSKFIDRGAITGIIRLTSDGSSHYLSLSSVDQQKFNEQMVTDLSYIIPVENNRLTPINGFEKDISTGNLQILLFFNIKDTSDLSKKSASNILQDFNALLKYKKYSALMNYNTTLLIDENYPMTIALLVILYFLASWKFKEADNFAMFKLIFIIADLGLRISFVINDARKVPELWLPTVLALDNDQ